MIKKHQRHPTNAACVILHVEGALSMLITNDNGKIEVVDQVYRNALETASADNTRPLLRQAGGLISCLA